MPFASIRFGTLGGVFALVIFTGAEIVRAASDEELGGKSDLQSTAADSVNTPSSDVSNVDGNPLDSVITLQLREEAEVRSPLIRLGDVVSLVGTPPENWKGISGIAIGILPSELKRVRLERRRIAEFLAASGRLPSSVRWIGPEFATVSLAAPNELPRRDKLGGPSSSNDQKEPTRELGQEGLSFVTTPGEEPIKKVVSPSESTPLLPAQRTRLERLLVGFFSQTHEEVFESFEVLVDTTDNRLANLQTVQNLTAMRMLGPPTAGTIDVEVTGDDGDRSVVQTVRLMLDPLPLVVFAKSTLNRGDILSQEDVMLKPVPKKQFDDQMATDVESMVGQQLTRALSPGRPLRMDDVSKPIVIKRGDLVEVHVIAAGFKISTQGRAMESGGVGDAVTVEIDQPRRKVLGRAAGYGVIEIISRPPVVSGSPS